MHAQNQHQDNEKKRRRKGLLWTFSVHAALGALLILPLVKMTMPDEPEDYETVVTMDFTEFDRASKKAADSSPKGGAKKQPKSPEKPKPAVKPLPTTPPVVEAPTPEPPIVTSPKVPQKPVPTKTPPVPVEDAQDPEPEPVDVEITDAPDTVESPADTAPGTGKGTGTSGNGKSTKPGKGTDATPGDGDEGMDFSGDGIFGRRVVYRADVKKITSEQGKIVINLCVNRVGRVVYSKYNADLSTIKTPAVIKKAEQLTAKYRFDKDYTASVKECGKLTFIFDINN